MPPPGKKTTTQASSSDGKESSGFLDLRDSFVPTFSGQPADYREWRQRLHLYQRKMAITKRGHEAVLNLVGSFTGVTWRLFQDWTIEELHKEDAFERIVRTLDANFSYDARVQLPNDFEGYFNLLQRQGGQTLLLYVTDHEEAYRKLQQHKVELPSSVQGWHLLRRASLSREQRQMITLKAPSLEKQAVIEAMYLILGQDYKGGGWNVERNRKFNQSSWRSHRAYAADDDFDYEEDDQWFESGYFEIDDHWPEDAYEPDYEDPEEFDYNAGYFGGEEPWPDNNNSTTETYNPQAMAEEFDQAFASYTDARKRFQELKMARGYLPTVALTDGQQGTPPSTSTTNSPTSSATTWRAKGKGKGGKKGKSKTTVRYPPQGAGKFDPKGRAKANLTCLRCGQPGHWAANCPQGSSSPTSRTSTKRPASTTEGMAYVVPPSETALLIFQDSEGRERPDCVMLDPGASAFLSGYGPFSRLLTHYKDIGYPVDCIKMTKGRRRFQFGGDASQWSDWSANIPVFVDGKYGTIELFLLPGNTPMLCGRPIIEALGMSMDFARRLLRIGGSPWQSATLGRQGEYLWSITHEHDLMQYDPMKPNFELRTNEPDVHQIDGYTLPDFIKEEKVLTSMDAPQEIPIVPGINYLKKNELKTMDVQLNTHINDLSAFLTQELHRPDRPRVLWEVYCGKARTSEIARSLGMETRQFSLETGWNFELLDHQEQFLVLVDEEMPDEILVAPECKLWSRMQSLGRRTPAQKEALVAARQHHHDRHLKFTKKIYLKQLTGGRHATIEQPKDALSWQTKALRDLPGHTTDFSQCRYGAQCLDDDGQWKPVLKNTRLRTTKKAVQDALCLQCLHDHEHCHLEGSARGFGVRTRYMEDYQPGLAATLAAALSVDEPPLHWEHAHAATEEKEVMGSLVRLKANTKQEAIRIVQRLHRNLGHPSAEALSELLAARGASETIAQAAKGYVCLACAKYKKPQQAAPAAMPTTDKFNDAVQADVLWVRRGSTKYAIMSMVDTATRYTAAALLRSEASEEYIKAVERMWIAHFGAPNKLVTDSGRPWLGHTMDAWTSAHNIDHIVAPGEAHERLALVERRHALIRRAVEIYMDDLGIDHVAGLKEGLTYIIPQMNATPSVAGFSPAQWVLGYQPQLSGDLLSDSFQPVHFGGNPDFEDLLNKRHAAKKALLEADTDRRLRRALGMKYKGTNTEYQLGQKVWFWRDAKQPILSRSDGWVLLMWS